jgi:pimeloyl-ACP methyl ester carboxylesterase
VKWLDGGMPEYVKSKDGTSIAYDVAGSGPALVITGGAFNTRHSPGELVGLLAPNFTVYTWDRRGRGDSGNRLPYAIERETEDLTAIIAAAGGSAFAYGHSSGAILTLEAALRGAAMTKIAIYEPSYVPGTPGAMAGVQPALDAGDPALAALTFVNGTGAENTDGMTRRRKPGVGGQCGDRDRIGCPGWPQAYPRWTGPRRCRIRARSGADRVLQLAREIRVHGKSKRETAPNTS